jgi:excinuclease UvrABC ATPase subunit
LIINQRNSLIQAFISWQEAINQSQLDKKGNEVTTRNVTSNNLKNLESSLKTKDLTNY